MPSSSPDSLVPELGRGLPRGVPVLLARLVVVGVVLGLCHGDAETEGGGTFEDASTQDRLQSADFTRMQ